MPIEKRTFQAFQEEENDDCNYVLESNVLRVWEYTKAKWEEMFVPYNSKKQNQLEKEVIILGLNYFFVKIYKEPQKPPYKTYITSLLESKVQLI